MLEKNYKLVIFDIDDTLIKRGKTEIETSAKNAIQKLQAKGIEVLVATGRAFYFIHQDIHQSISPNYYVCTNGACVYNKDRELEFKVQMNLDEVNAFIDYARKHDLAIALKMEHDMPVYHDLNIFQTTYMQGSPLQHILRDCTTSTETVKEDVMGIFMMGNETLIENAQTLTQDTFAHAYQDAYDIYSKDAGKIKGIEYVLKKLNLDWDDVIAFGDAANDQEMIQKAGLGIAMGNSTQTLKDLADFTTKDILDDGIEYALKHFKLI